MIDLLFPPEFVVYLNIMIISFFTSIILFIPVPYIPILIAASFDSMLNPVLIAFTSAIGITAGRTVIFLASYYGRKILKDTSKERLLPLQRFLMKYGWIGAFLSALTPFPPDDMVIILLGIAKYHPLKFVIANFAGKMIANIAVVMSAILLGRPLIEKIFMESQNPMMITVITSISIVLIGLIVYLVTKADWAKIIGKWFPWTLEETDGDGND
ncbi:MAG: VTT domain-containing protein [Thermoproteota archaeon]|nr:VTT domain-containing protein [Thermoproteota archaeon]